MKFFAYAIAFGLFGLALQQSLKRAIEFANDLHQMSEDIHVIRETLEPKPLTFGAEPPPFRARVDFRENSHQEPEVTLL